MHTHRDSESDDETQFYQYFRMTKECFVVLENKLRPHLLKKDTVMLCLSVYGIIAPERLKRFQYSFFCIKGDLRASVLRHV